MARLTFGIEQVGNKEKNLETAILVSVGFLAGAAVTFFVLKLLVHKIRTDAQAQNCAREQQAHNHAVLANWKKPNEKV